MKLLLYILVALVLAFGCAALLCTLLLMGLLARPERLVLLWCRVIWISCAVLLIMSLTMPL